MVNLEVLDGPTDDFFTLLPTANHSCSDLGEWTVSDHLNNKKLAENQQSKPPVSALDSPGLAEASSSTDSTTTLDSGNFSLLLILAIRSYHYFMEAHDLIGSLSLRNTN